jgi:leader peptidase (prepilin peptidase) / N-methyltransferase
LNTLADLPRLQREHGRAFEKIARSRDGVAFLHCHSDLRHVYSRRTAPTSAQRESNIAFHANEIDLISMTWVILAASPFVGSFLGLLAVRIPQHRQVISGRSQCDACGHVLGASDLIPFASWLWLREHCRYCGARIGALPILMELAATGVAIWAATQTSNWVLAASCLFGWWLLVLAVIDWREFLLPDMLTLPLIVAGLAISYALDPAALADHLIGAAAGFAVFAAIAFAYKRLRGHEGLGFGDAKLMAALGAWLGWQGLPTTLLFGAFAALTYVLVRSLAGRRIADPIPFGAFLALGGWVVWLYGPLTA